MQVWGHLLVSFVVVAAAAAAAAAAADNVNCFSDALVFSIFQVLFQPPR